MPVPDPEAPVYTVRDDARLTPNSRPKNKESAPTLKRKRCMLNFLSAYFGLGHYFLFFIPFIACGIAMIVMGSIYFYDCPSTPFLRFYMILSGCFGVPLSLYVIGKKLTEAAEQMTPEERSERKIISGKTSLSATITLFLIVGSIVVYVYANDLPEYCNRTMYWFTFWTVTGVYAFVVFNLALFVLFSQMVTCLTRSAH